MRYLRPVLLAVVVFAAGYFAGTFHPSKIDAVLFRDNELLQEQVRLQKKLIEAYEAEREDLRKAADWQAT